MTTSNVDRGTSVVPLSTDDANLEYSECFCFHFSLPLATDVDRRTSVVPLSTDVTLEYQLTAQPQKQVCSDFFLPSKLLYFCFVLIVRRREFYDGLVTSHSRLTFHGRIYLFVRIKPTQSS